MKRTGLARPWPETPGTSVEPVRVGRLFVAARDGGGKLVVEREVEEGLERLALARTGGALRAAAN